MQAFADTLDLIRERGTSEVVFLGDLFKALVGFSRFWDEPVREGLALLAGLRKSGMRVVMVEGNRDFFLDAPELDPFRDNAGLVHSFVAGGRRFLCEHGDTINRHDHFYLFWRSISKSRTARLWARLLPRRLAQHIVHTTEAQLAQTNFTHRRSMPECFLERASLQHFAAGVDAVIWGHFHRSWRLVRGCREATVLPAWLNTGTVAWVDAHGHVEIEAPASGQFVDSAPGSWYQGCENGTVAR
jgi:UDP-2,3-diacylglucosamine pyrophosphatase LpxH